MSDEAAPEGAPIQYSILCPPGWTRVPARAIAEAEGVSAAFDRLRAAGRADLWMQLRHLLARYRRGVAESGAFETYMPPLIDGVMIPAVMVVSPLTRPPGVPWPAALARLSRGIEVRQADFTPVPMWTWRTAGRLPIDGEALSNAQARYVVPVPSEGEALRALSFDMTVLTPPDGKGADGTDALLLLGDLMLSTMRWLS